MKLFRYLKKYYIKGVVRGRQLYKIYRNRFKGVEVELYDLNKKLHPYFKGLSISLMLLALLSLVASFGFELPEEYFRLNEYLEIVIILGFFTLFLSRIIFTSRRGELVRSHFLEALLFLLLSVGMVLYLLGLESVFRVWGSLLGIEDTFPLLVLLTKVYLVLLVVAKTIQAAPLLISLQRHPARMIVGSFALLILFGALLLMMPRTTVDGQGLDFVNALFTSTSAVCVTGLIVVDTATHFTTLGQSIILVLIQLGGLGIITFATLFALLVSDRLGIGQMVFLKDVLSQDRAQETFRTVKRIIALTFSVEALGVAGYYLSWTGLFPDAGTRLYHSLFHAISAFCNAGFSTFTNSLADSGNALNSGVNITTMLMIVLGGLGFTTLWELVRGNPRRKIRNRKLSVHTRLVLITTALLIVGGTIAITALEWNHTLQGFAASDKWMMGLFQSVTTRTAGFNTIDIGALSSSTTVLFLVLMAIGASPASTGGGIKTTTIAVLLLTVYATVRGHDRVEFSRKTIPQVTIYTAITAFTLAATSLFVFTLLLTFTEDLPFVDLLFEEFSAFATVGLSRGITADLSTAGRIIVTVSMFIGRVGSVTMALAFAKRIHKRQYQYPKESVIVA
ncbi:TrkH family potassium uptake protein [Fodinibius sediminis]|uniref:Potassium uptake protein, TrkH family n=1 Tax=Fodinibius sediminis TaxID=1214077 RepID=A0A521E2W5_9BACT|nr:potassium transporter TrkG [Fodinibius sediminis]SMO78175.1 potassium uptake protein, TrkH family [Fodinibius sediminis]